MKAARFLLLALAASIAAIANAQTGAQGTTSTDSSAPNIAPCPYVGHGPHMGGAGPHPHMGGAGPHPHMGGAHAHSHDGSGPHGPGYHHGMGMHGAMAGRWLGRMDTDGDGQVSLEEFKAMQKRQLDAFERADTDRDGKLSSDEMRAARQAMRDRYRHEHHGSMPGQPPCITKPERKPAD
jgi:hypothetical protein